MRDLCAPREGERLARTRAHTAAFLNELHHVLAPRSPYCSGVLAWREDAPARDISLMVVDAPNCRFSLSSVCLVLYRLTVY